MKSMKDLYSKYVVWDDKNVKGFFEEYRFLSNFELCDVWFEGDLYPSSEHAYMASKTLDLDIRKRFIKNNPFIFAKNENGGSFFTETKILTPKEAKNLGQTIELRPCWEIIKYDMMLAIVFDKFWRNSELKQKLLATGNKYLEETNHWNDMYWGFSWQKQTGENNLGKILMKVREILKR